jgi:hypothetical protein
MARGIYERPKYSGIWWILYYVDGKRRREKVGRKSDAIKLYQSRKADALAGRKLPELRGSRVLTLSELIDDALEFVADHKDRRNYLSRGRLFVSHWDHVLLQRSHLRSWNVGCVRTAKPCNFE